MYVLSRSSHNPLISPNKDHSWEEVSTCNGSACVVDGTLHMTYRAISVPDKLEAKGLARSTIGYAKTKDGMHFGSRKQLIVPKEEWEKFGCEDPKISYFEGKYYIFYTAISEYPITMNGIRVAVAVSKDLKKIDERHLVTPFNAKAMTIFPERIKGKIAVIFSANTDKPPAKTSIAYFDQIEDLWDEERWQSWYNEIDKHSLELKRNDGDHIEIGAAPLKTKDGWLLIYSHIQNYFGSKPIFGIEAFLLDLKDPMKIVARSDYPFLAPEAVYEKYGLVPNITFPSGAVIHKGNLDIYYGASDTTTCRATVVLDDFLTSLNPETRMQIVKRSDKNPILMPIIDSDWESKNVFNPAAIALKGKVHILYRAMGSDRISTIGYASSIDGEWIDQRLKDPVYVPREDFEKKKGARDGNSGCEDPRITKIKDTLYMCYTAYDGVNVPRVALSRISVKDFVAKDFNAWSRPILLTPSGVDDKDACLIPCKEKGKIMILHRIESHICADILNSEDGFTYDEVNKCIEVLHPRNGMWDGLKVGIGAPPIRTKRGWLLLYHGVSQDKVYRVGAALLDSEDPSMVLSRSTDAIFEPIEQYEKEGEVSNVVFPCGAVERDGKVFMYYGGADRVIGMASFELDDILDKLLVE